MNSPTPQEIMDLVDKISKFLPLNVHLNVTLGPPNDPDQGFVGRGLASTDRPEPQKLLDMARARVAFLEKEVERLLFCDKSAAEQIAGWQREYENMKRLMTAAEERVLILEAQIKASDEVVDSLLADRDNWKEAATKRLRDHQVTIHEREKFAEECNAAQAELRESEVEVDRICTERNRLYAALHDIKARLTNVPQVALAGVVTEVYRLAQSALGEAVPHSKVKQENVKAALEKLLNSCWCDDGGQLPECRVCVELRRIWKGM